MAVGASQSMAGVLRYFGLAQNGGSHAHLRRRINALGIDTSHFTRRTTHRSGISTRRRRPEEVLVLRERLSRRVPPELLRRSMSESGVPAECAECGIGPSWNGKPLTLQVDHHNGAYWDCRLENLRLLCPNCHSQTPTYAGRNRRTFGIQVRHADQLAAEAVGEERPPGTEEHPDRRRPVSEQELIELIHQVDRQQLTVVQAARLIGCHRNHFHRLRRRLRETGDLTRPPAGRRWRSEIHREKVIAHALAHPELGPKRLAAQLRGLPTGGCTVSHGTVSRILREVGLNTVAARRSRLISQAGVV